MTQAVKKSEYKEGSLSARLEKAVAGPEAAPVTGGKLVHPKVYWSSLNADKQAALLKSVGADTSLAGKGFDKIPVQQRMAIANATKGARGGAPAADKSQIGSGSGNITEGKPAITAQTPRITGRGHSITPRQGRISPHTPRLK